MRSEEIYEELKLSYYDLVDYLLKKYGGSSYDYFCNDKFDSPNSKVTRTKEGLYCHHMDEDKGGNLANPWQAQLQPYEWQKKERLLYCNIIEHLILHIKIAILRQKKRLLKPKDIEAFFTTGGIFMICQDINDMFKSSENLRKWQKRCFLEIKENYVDYIFILKILFSYIQSQYKGEKKKAVLKVGSKVGFADCSAEILELNEAHDRVLLKLPNGKEELFRTSSILIELEYEDIMDLKARRISKGCGEKFYSDIYKDILKEIDISVIENLSQYLLIDFHGYGFAQFTDCYIDRSKYGASNIDEYICNAYPPYLKPSYDIGTDMPRFWKGNTLPQKISSDENIFYIIRIEASFNIKSGEKPFVRCKEGLYISNRKIGEDNNLLYKRGTVLGTSDICDKETEKMKRATAILTLTKDDYLLFKRKYTIRKMTILDGCYFEE